MNELEKQHLCAIARKAGFDVSNYREDDWVECVSSMQGARVWLSRREQFPGEICCAFEQMPQERLREWIKPAFLSLIPAGSTDAFRTSEDDLLSVLRFLCSSVSMDCSPISHTVFESDGQEINRCIHEQFKRRGLDSERDTMVRERTCQDLFRNGLMELYHGQCVITGIKTPELLVASHIKPWSVCNNDYERIDVFNGLLLAVHLDKLFDQGFISFASDGNIMVSDKLSNLDRNVFNINCDMHINMFSEMDEYMAYHREYIYR